MKKTINQSTMVIILNSLSIIFIVTTIISFLNVIVVNSKIEQSNVDRFDLTYNANRFMNGSAYLTNEVRAFAVTGDIEHYNNYWDEINVLKNRDIGVQRLKEIGITQEEQTKIEAMSALSNNLVPLESDAMDMTKEGRKEEAIEAVYGADYYKTIGQIQSIKEEFLTMLDARAENSVNNLIAQGKKLQYLTLIFIVIVAVLQLLNVLLIMVKIIVPIKKVRNEMEEIAKGNLSSAFSLTPNTSEIGKLTNSIIETKSELKKYIGDISDKLKHISDGELNIHVDMDYIGDFAPIKSALVKIIDSLNDTISQINIASQQVSTGAKQIADGSQLLAQGSVEQTSSVQQLSLSISEVTEKTAHNVNMANEAANLSSIIKNNAEKGTEQMAQMMQAVQEINDASASIKKVIKVIDDIAFQTNILALNAAVEAARAGQHGKGFAVVADEVRNLAAKSAIAAKDTGSLIENSIQKADLGLHIAIETSASLLEIVEGINKSAEIVAVIARSSDKQAEAITQINQGIDQVAQVVQQNSATAEESAAASEQMSSQSTVLEQLVAQFKIRSLSANQSSAYSNINVPVPINQSSNETGFAMSSYAKY